MSKGRNNDIPSLDRRAFLRAAGAAAVSGIVSDGPAKAEAAADLLTVYLGSFTSSGNPRGRGLEVGAVDAATGRLTLTGQIDGVPDASFLALSPDRRTLYAVNERKPAGTVTALDIGDDPRRPRLLNTQTSGGSGPTHLSVHPGGRHLLTANYADGTIVVHPLSADGRIHPPSDIVRHPSAANAHQAVTDPGGQWIVTTDVGAQSVFVYGLDQSAGRLRLHQHLQLPAGFGPRHLTFHPGGQYAYILGERRSEITLAAWDTAAGRLTPGQVIGTLGNAEPRRNFPAEIQVSRDGQFLYASNRGHDSIATFRIQGSGERLVFAGTAPSGGAWPRHFTLDPSERWLYVANQRSNSLCWLPRDAESGMIGAPAGSVPANSVGMILFR